MTEQRDDKVNQKNNGEQIRQDSLRRRKIALQDTSHLVSERLKEFTQVTTKSVTSPAIVKKINALVELIEEFDAYFIASSTQLALTNEKFAGDHQQLTDDILDIVETLGNNLSKSKLYQILIKLDGEERIKHNSKEAQFLSYAKDMSARALGKKARMETLIKVRGNSSSIDVSEKLSEEESSIKFDDYTERRVITAGKVSQNSEVTKKYDGREDGKKNMPKGKLQAKPAINIDRPDEHDNSDIINKEVQLHVAPIQRVQNQSARNNSKSNKIAQIFKGFSEAQELNQEFTNKGLSLSLKPSDYKQINNQVKKVVNKIKRDLSTAWRKTGKNDPFKLICAAINRRYSAEGLQPSDVYEFLRLAFQGNGKFKTLSELQRVANTLRINNPILKSVIDDYQGSEGRIQCFFGSESAKSPLDQAPQTTDRQRFILDAINFLYINNIQQNIAKKFQNHLIAGGSNRLPDMIGNNFKNEHSKNLIGMVKSIEKAIPVKSVMKKTGDRKPLKQYIAEPIPVVSSQKANSLIIDDHSSSVDEEIKLEIGDVNFGNKYTQKASNSYYSAQQTDVNDEIMVERDNHDDKSGKDSEIIIDEINLKSHLKKGSKSKKAETIIDAEDEYKNEVPEEDELEKNELFSQNSYSPVKKIGPAIHFLNEFIPVLYGKQNIDNVNENESELILDISVKQLNSLLSLLVKFGQYFSPTGAQVTKYATEFFNAGLNVLENGTFDENNEDHFIFQRALGAVKDSLVEKGINIESRPLTNRQLILEVLLKRQSEALVLKFLNEQLRTKNWTLPEIAEQIQLIQALQETLADCELFDRHNPAQKEKWQQFQNAVGALNRISKEMQRVVDSEFEVDYFDHKKFNKITIVLPQKAERADDKPLTITQKVVGGGLLGVGIVLGGGALVAAGIVGTIILGLPAVPVVIGLGAVAGTAAVVPSVAGRALIGPAKLLKATANAIFNTMPNRLVTGIGLKKADEPLKMKHRLMGVGLEVVGVCGAGAVIAGGAALATVLSVPVAIGIVGGVVATGVAVVAPTVLGKIGSGLKSLFSKTQPVSAVPEQPLPEEQIQPAQQILSNINEEKHQIEVKPPEQESIHIALSPIDKAGTSPNPSPRPVSRAGFDGIGKIDDEAESEGTNLPAFRRKRSSSLTIPSIGGMPSTTFSSSSVPLRDNYSVAGVSANEDGSTLLTNWDDYKDIDVPAIKI